MKTKEEILKPLKFRKFVDPLTELVTVDDAADAMQTFADQETKPVQDELKILDETFNASLNGWHKDRKAFSDEITRLKAELVEAVELVSEFLDWKKGNNDTTFSFKKLQEFKTKHTK